MKITKKEVDHVASLARIRIRDDEKEKFTQQLSSILEYVNQLKEVDTSGVNETAQVAGIENSTRSDQVENCDKDIRSDIIKNFPEREDNLLKTKSVF